MHEDGILSYINLSFHYSVLISSFYSVVMVKFTASSYTVNEGASQVEICTELSGQAELARPIQMRVTSNDGTATGSFVVKSIPYLIQLYVVTHSCNVE